MMFHLVVPVVRILKLLSTIPYQNFDLPFELICVIGAVVSFHELDLLLDR